ncbi:phosphonate metabolism protein/1,5-bisphosphokinase (PRPP-forming) PhnN [Tabrizicola sp. J26]|uniref:phosphonate metabolism protein/1,5-bisphosphokinase (PRPP-forming) PhnN n=1 Tax=Alitabrizicola rongguiensis TaxID=2909234 RepID=UPI001F1EE3F8|nr:phosphonate metabolism protein/1,5-bisphosphokinase (PRPP-forming) PhnN [Tabrizicola rongguiensis]MCF1710819.1 phosphonate metabolism protein/1,5-bisphosphokinase (PRPP-forming) PhnN [Tabrizicola rongguiensis]
MSGRIFAIVGPSGVGKDTLLAGAVAADPRLHWAKRVITRPASAGGEPFEGVTVEEFERRRAAGEFALHWTAHGLSYGIPTSEIAGLAEGRDILFNGSRAALPAARAAFPEVRVIRISAPSSVLAERLLARGRESRAEIEARLARASYDLPPDCAVIDIRNDSTPQVGIARLCAALRETRHVL